MTIRLHRCGLPAVAAEWPCLPAVGTYVNQGGLWVVSAVVLTSEAVEVYAVAVASSTACELTEQWQAWDLPAMTPEATPKGSGGVGVNSLGGKGPRPFASVPQFFTPPNGKNDFFESVASLLGIVIDRLSVLPYFPGPKVTTEGSHVGTGRIPSRLYRGNHTC